MRTSKEGLEAGGTVAAKTRRRWAVEEKRRIVEETLRPGASIAHVARAHCVNANQVHLWRRQYEHGRLAGAGTGAALLPVRVIEDEQRVAMAGISSGQAAVPAPVRPQRGRLAGVIQIEVARGRLRVEGHADPAALRVALECLLG
jgi:transposase